MTRCYQLYTKGFVFSTILFKGNISNISAFLSRSQTCINKRFCQGEFRWEFPHRLSKFTSIDQQFKLSNTCLYNIKTSQFTKRS